jgi:hypothetical protein
MNNGGDVLARGGKRAQFSGPKVSQDKWDAIWAEETPVEERPANKKSARERDNKKKI